MNLSYLLFFIASIHFSSENCLKSNKNLLNLEILYFSHSCCKKKAHLLKIYNQQCTFFLTFILYFSEIFYYWQTTSAIKWRHFQMIILNRHLISYLVRTRQQCRTFRHMHSSHTACNSDRNRCNLLSSRPSVHLKSIHRNIEFIPADFRSHQLITDSSPC